MEGQEALLRAAEILATVPSNDPLGKFCEKLSRWIKSAVDELGDSSSQSPRTDSQD